jgi:hypothetical protein
MQAAVQNARSADLLAARNGVESLVQLTGGYGNMAERVRPNRLSFPPFPSPFTQAPPHDQQEAALAALHRVSDPSAREKLMSRECDAVVSQGAIPALVSALASHGGDVAAVSFLRSASP